MCAARTVFVGAFKVLSDGAVLCHVTEQASLAF